MLSKLHTHSFVAGIMAVLLPALALGIGGVPRASVQWGVVTVANTATQLLLPGTKSFCVKVPVGGQIVYVGGATVTTTNGFPVDAGTAYCDDLDLGAGGLYGIVASSTQSTRIIGSN